MSVNNYWLNTVLHLLFGGERISELRTGCRGLSIMRRLKTHFTVQPVLLVLTVLLLVFAILPSSAAELYRYQDANGRWVFGDKKSLGNDLKVNQKAQRITVKGVKNDRLKPDFIILNSGFEGSDTSASMAKSVKHGSWQLSNPLPVDIQHWLRVKGKKTFFTSLMAKPGQTIILDPSDYNLADNFQPIEHYYLLGKPIAKPEMQIIPLPYKSSKKFKISQGFKGQYSHTGRGNRYAVDIAMPIGATVSAVYSGIVADLRDDFSMGGSTNYFLDKANHVTVMHEDGTIAIYAHILYGSAKVKIGDKVKAGDELARVGNTGFSTGPHLHFVMRYNSGNGSYSIPFRFKTVSGIKQPLEGKFYKAL